MELHPGQQVVGRLKAVDLALLLIKGADHAHTGQVLAGQAQHTVQPGLGRFVQRLVMTMTPNTTTLSSGMATTKIQAARTFTVNA